MSSLPYFLLMLPVIDLAVSNPNAADLMLSLWFLSIAWRRGWMRW